MTKSDWERESLLDEIYLAEAYHDMISNWESYEKSKKKPAIVRINKISKNENAHNTSNI